MICFGIFLELAGFIEPEYTIKAVNAFIAYYGNYIWLRQVTPRILVQLFKESLCNGHILNFSIYDKNW